MTDPDDRTPEDEASDERSQREGFNPLLAILLIALAGLALFTLFAVLG